MDSQRAGSYFPLTKRTKQGELYVRRDDAQMQIEAVAEREIAEIRPRLYVTDRADELYLLDETLVFLYRRALFERDDSLAEAIFIAMDVRIVKLLLKHKNSGFIHGCEFDDFLQDVRISVLRKIGDLASDIGDFAQVQFGSFVSSEAKCVGKKNFGLKERERIDDHSGRDDDNDSDLLENAVSPDPGPEFKAMLRQGWSQFSDEQRTIVCMLLDGFQSESKDPNETTISSYLNVTSRTIRNKIGEIRRIAAEAVER
ncbi:MAG: hypothetical protein KIS76_19250 [Pyrinomonadaceae bacterium]|nr:hypothetical protein [Pyrinomonadaceae bacterium]